MRSRPTLNHEWVELVRDQVDIVAAAEKITDLSRSGSQWMGMCPFHDERTPSFKVNAAKGVFYCFGCRAGGDIFTLYQMSEGVGFTEAALLLADAFGIARPAGAEGAIAVGNQKDSEILELTAQHWAKQLPQFDDAADYAVDRIPSEQVRDLYNIGYCAPSATPLIRFFQSVGVDFADAKRLHLMTGDGQAVYADRLTIPISDRFGNMVGFAGRRMGPSTTKTPKYVNSRESDTYQKSETLYNLHLAKRSGSRVVIVCEGYLDVLAFACADIPYAVALCGTALTPAQAKQLVKFRDVILFFDADRAGQEATNKAIATLHGTKNSPHVLVPRDLTAGTDPADLVSDPAALRTLVHQDGLEPALDWAIRTAFGQSHDRESEIEALRQSTEIVKTISDAPTAAASIETISNRLKYVPYGYGREFVASALRHTSRPEPAAGRTTTQNPASPAKSESATTPTIEPGPTNEYVGLALLIQYPEETTSAVALQPTLWGQPLHRGLVAALTQTENGSDEVDLDDTQLALYQSAACYSIEDQDRATLQREVWHNLQVGRIRRKLQCLTAALDTETSTAEQHSLHEQFIQAQQELQHATAGAS